MIRVAVVDDSTFMRKALTRMLGEEEGIELVGSAGSGEEFLANLDRWQPDVVTLDLNMPGIGGLATLDRLMARRPTPVIILSTHSGEGAPMTIEALHRGAIDFIDKQLYSLVDFEALRAVLLNRIFQVAESLHNKPPDSQLKLLRPGTSGAPGTLRPQPAAPGPQPSSRLKPDATRSDTARPDVRRFDPEPEPRPRRRRLASDTTPSEVPEVPEFAAGSTVFSPGAYELIVIGASTGGPPTIERILHHLGSVIPVPVVVVQHMPVGFTQAFAERLNAYLPFKVQEAIASEPLLPSTIYIAPAGSHLRLRRHEGRIITLLSPHPQDVSHVPSIDILFFSAASVTAKRTIGVLLTGMGRDGAQGLRALREAGAYTLAQDEASSVVFGMPRAAIDIAAVTEVAAPEAIGLRLRTLINVPEGLRKP